MAAGDVIDFFWEWHRSHMQSKTSALAQMALDRCEETLLWRDWKRFGYWHSVYMRERRRLEREEL